MGKHTGSDRRVTSFDVAELAGVSQPTVSRALNGDPSVTEATRLRVESAANQLGYRVDARAAGLRTGKTRTLAVVVIARAGQPATHINPFHYSLLGNVCTAASARGYQALVSVQSEPGDFYSDYIESRQADGMILLGTSTNDLAWEYHRALLDRDDVACWGSPFDDHRRIASDNRAGGKLAAARLLQGGYRKLRFIGDIGISQTQFRERYEGFCDGLIDAGVEVTEPLFVPAATRAEQGRRAIELLLANNESCDGVFCCCDAMALGALEALCEAGKAVPAEFGVIGFDGLATGIHSNPPLTTIEPDFTLAGQMLVDAALRLARADANNSVPVRVVERGSVRS